MYINLIVSKKKKITIYIIHETDVMGTEKIKSLYRKKKTNIPQRKCGAREKNTVHKMWTRRSSENIGINDQKLYNFFDMLLWIKSRLKSRLHDAMMTIREINVADMRELRNYICEKCVRVRVWVDFFFSKFFQLKRSCCDENYFKNPWMNLYLLIKFSPFKDGRAQIFFFLFFLLSNHRRECVCVCLVSICITKFKFSLSTQLLLIKKKNKIHTYQIICKSNGKHM